MFRKPAATTVIVFLFLVFLAHLLRLAMKVEIVAGGVTVPFWVSVLGVLAAGGLAIWLWRESRG
jgi:hypothetical protein